MAIRPEATHQNLGLMEKQAPAGFCLLDKPPAFFSARHALTVPISRIPFTLPSGTCGTDVLRGLPGYLYLAAVFRTAVFAIHPAVEPMHSRPP